MMLLSSVSILIEIENITITSVTIVNEKMRSCLSTKEAFLRATAIIAVAVPNEIQIKSKRQASHLWVIEYPKKAADDLFRSFINVFL
jgi:hypothetical protein